MAHMPLILRDVYRGDLEAVQQRVLANAAVLEERSTTGQYTALMGAVGCEKPAIALWLIEHRDQHDVNTADDEGWTALHDATKFGPLEVVQALMAAGANSAAFNEAGLTPIMLANLHGHTDIVASLLQLRTSIDHLSPHSSVALSCASRNGRQPIVQILLDAGADPTIPAGPSSPLNLAISNNHNTIAAVLRHAIGEAERARALHKVRCLLGAGVAALACLQGRVEQGQAMPQMGFARRGRSRNKKLQGTAAFAVGMAGGEKDTGLCEQLYVELLQYMLPAWADKGPNA